MPTLRADYSTLAAFKSCPQKFVNDYLLRLQPKSLADESALNFGSLIHFGLEIVGLSKLDSLPPLEACIGEIEYLSSGNPPLIDPFGCTLDALRSKHVLIQALHATAAHAAAQGMKLCGYTPDSRRSLRHALLLLTRYVFNYHPESIAYTSFEQFLEASLGSVGSDTQVVYCGTVDGTTNDALVEHKTTSYLSSSFLERTNPSDQVTGYLWLFQQKFPERKIMKTIFDGISTSGYGISYGATTSRPAQWTINKEPNKLFLRTETYRTQDQLDDWHKRTLDTCARLVETIKVAQQSKLVERRAPDACTEFNSTCKFINLCRASNATEEVSLRETLFTTQAQWKGFKWES